MDGAQHNHSNASGNNGSGGGSSSLSAPVVGRHELARKHVPVDASAAAAMQAYRKYRDAARLPFLERYAVLGFLSSGTYGKVYKARVRLPPTSGAANRPGQEDARPDLVTRVTRAEETGEEMHAIKKFKPDKETETLTYTGISQSAMREIAVSRRPSPGYGTCRPVRGLTLLIRSTSPSPLALGTKS